MDRLEASAVVRRPLAEVWEAHQGFDLFSRIYPPLPQAQVIDSPPGPIEQGSEFTVRLSVGPAYLDWRVQIVRHEPMVRFVDRQVSGPFRFWEHTHQFSALDPGTTLVVESLLFETDNPLLDAFVVRPALEALFAWREWRMVEELGKPS